MAFLKRINWMLVIIVAIIVIKFYPKIMNQLRKTAPSVANALEPKEAQTTTTADIKSRKNVDVE